MKITLCIIDYTWCREELSKADLCTHWIDQKYQKIISNCCLIHKRSLYKYSNTWGGCHTFFRHFLKWCVIHSFPAYFDFHFQRSVRSMVKFLYVVVVHLNTDYSPPGCRCRLWQEMLFYHKFATSESCIYTKSNGHEKENSSKVPAPSNWRNMWHINNFGRDSRYSLLVKHCSGLRFERSQV